MPIIKLKKPYMEFPAGERISVSNNRAGILIGQDIAFPEDITQAHAKRYSEKKPPVVVNDEPDKPDKDITVNVVKESVKHSENGKNEKKNLKENIEGDKDEQP